MSGKALKETSSERIRQLAEALYPYHLKYEKARDARAVFAYVYFNITLDLANRLENSQSSFENPEWVADLALAFAKRYIFGMEAIDAWLENKYQSDDPSSIKTIYDAVPRPWADVYIAICGKQSYVMEDLLFSMCAHITYDLPNALLDVNPTVSCLADYHTMNDVLADRTEFMQEVVGDRYQHFLIWLDWITGSFDEFFTNYGIRMARSVAWYNAMRLMAPPARDKALASIEQSTSKFINSVRNPKEWWLRLGVRITRLIIPRRRRWPGSQQGRPTNLLEFDAQHLTARPSRW